MRTATVAAAEVAGALVTLAAAPPRGRATDLGGPEEAELADLVRRYLTATGQRRRVLRVPLPGAAGRRLREGVLVPGPGADRGRQTFDEWLRQAPALSGARGPAGRSRRTRPAACTRRSARRRHGMSSSSSPAPRPPWTAREPPARPVVPGLPGGARRPVGHRVAVAGRVRRRRRARRAGAGRLRGAVRGRAHPELGVPGLQAGVRLSGSPSRRHQHHNAADAAILHVCLSR
jgi:hypothetical protein